MGRPGPRSGGFRPLGVVLATSDVRGLAATLARARWGWYLAAQLHHGHLHHGARLALGLFVAPPNMVIPSPRSFFIFNAGSLAGTVTPGRLGDFAASFTSAARATPWPPPP